MFLLKRVIAFSLAAILMFAALAIYRMDDGRSPLEAFLPHDTMDSFAGDFLAARFALNEQDIQGARKYLELALEKEPEDRDLLKRSIEFYFSEGFTEKALELSQRYVMLYPQPIDNPHVLLALAAAREGNYAEASALLQPAEETADDEEQVPSLNSEVVVPLIDVWMKVGQKKNDQAIAELDELKNSIALPLVQFQAALIQDLSGNTTAAESEYDSVIENASHSLRVAQTASNFFTRIGKPDKAAEAQEDYLGTNPGAMDQSLFGSKDVELPVTTAKQGLADLFMEIASFLNLGEQEGRSLFYIRLALYIQPDFPHARLMLGNILRGLSRYQDAIYAYHQVSTPPSFAWQARINIARMYAALKEYDKAKSLLLSMAEEDKSSYDSQLTLADILMDKKEFTQAAEFYTRAVERLGDPEPFQWVVYYARGICYERSKQWEKAEQDFKKALELNPGQADVLNYLAYSWLTMDRNVQQAHDMLEQAVEDRPGDAHILDSYGWALYKLGNYPEAMKYLEQANEMIPNDPTTNDHLGDVYWYIGRKREARFQWERALYFKPEPEDILAIEHKLSDGLPLPEVTLTGATPKKQEKKSF